ncbi:unnamed protein product, partial [Iphiclides podalirius]
MARVSPLWLGGTRGRRASATVAPMKAGMDSVLYDFQPLVYYTQSDSIQTTSPEATCLKFVDQNILTHALSLNRLKLDLSGSAGWREGCLRALVKSN